MYDVTWDTIAAEHKDQILRDYPRMVELFKAIDWMLKRDPTDQAYLIVEGADFYIYKNTPTISDAIPGLQVNYRVQEKDMRVFVNGCRIT
jgi:hypothetical protein